MTAVRMDLTELFDGISNQAEVVVIAEIAKGLIEEIPPSQIAGRMAIPAALGDGAGTAVPAVVAAGRIGDWIRVIPPGPETGAERRQLLLPAGALVAAGLFARPAISFGLANQKLTLPEPLFPKDVQHKDGAWGALRDALSHGDAQLVGRLLMGFYGSGTDYREMEGSIYYALLGTFAADGGPLLATTKATQALDYVEWGERVPVLFQWLIPQLMKSGAEPQGTDEVRAFLGQPEKSLEFVRVRIRMATADAAGVSLRRAVMGETTPAVLAAVYQSLKDGATGAHVATQICVTAAEHLAGVPLDDAVNMQAAINAVRVANSVRIAVTHVQDIRVLPLIFHSANLVNQTVRVAGTKRVTPTVGANSSPLAGGLIEYGVLRNIERQLTARDEGGARATAHRFATMAFPGRSLVGTLGMVAARADIAADTNGRGMIAVQALGEDYLALTTQQQGAEGVALIDAALHVLASQPTDHALADRIDKLTGTAVTA